MFEYVSMVEAPVRRFTGIVTDPDPIEDVEPVAPAPMPGRAAARLVVPTPSVAASVVEPPADVMPECATRAPVARERASAPTPASVTPRMTPRPAARAVARPAASAATSPFVRAFLGVAVAGITAMWWLRRDSHHR